MGNNKSSKNLSPNLEKKVKDFSAKFFNCSSCEMQGWRPKMEDTTMTFCNDEVSIFGVFDGHGGPQVAKFVAKYFYQVLSNLNEYKNNQYEQALIKTFLKFDEILKHDSVNDVLSKYSITSNQDENQIALIDFLDFNNKKNEDNIERESFLNISTEVTLTNKRNKEFKAISSNSIKQYDPNKLIKVKSNPDYSSDSDIAINKKKNSIINYQDEHTIYTLAKDSSEKISENLISYEVGTTANILLLRQKFFYIANAGDSLAVVYKKGKAIKLNTEHKTFLKSERNRILNAGNTIINKRIEGKLNISRAIGDFDFKNKPHLRAYEQALISYPEVRKYKITSDIEFILMASDGVWDCLNHQQICDHISIKLKEKLYPISLILEEIFDTIISNSKNNSIGTDNMSCILIQFNWQIK